MHVRATGGDPAAVEILVRQYEGLVRSRASRARRGDENSDDLVQVAYYGLLKAIERFDVDRGFEFSTFAYATIDGELKRYRRATSWAVHVPRSLQERYLHVASAAAELALELGRQPTIADIGARVGANDTDVIEALESADLRRPVSLDAAPRGEDGHLDVASTEAGYVSVEGRGLAEHLLSRLAARERQIVELRFYHELTQSQIAGRLGMSQMHVSRILRRAIERLRVLAAEA